MKTEYYRITAYHAPEGFSIIADSYGKFEKLWEFSAYLVERGFRIIAVDREQFFIDGTMEKVDAPSDKLMIRTVSKDEPRRFPGTGYEDKTGILVQLGDAAYLSEVNRISKAAARRSEWRLFLC